MVYQSFEGCRPKQNPRISLIFLTDIVQFSSRIIRLVINILYVYRFITAINNLRLRGQYNEENEENKLPKVRAPYMCATRHHLSVQPDVVELYKDLRKLMYRFKLQIRFIAHTTQHYPQLLFQTLPLFETSVQKLQCSLDDLEMAATFDRKNEKIKHTACSSNKSKVLNNNSHMSPYRPRNSPTNQTESVQSRKATRNVTKVDSLSDTTQIGDQQSAKRTGRLRRLETDEEQVYIIARNIHLTLNTLLIDAKLVHLTAKNGIRAGVSTVLFPFIYDIGKKFCLSFHYLKLLSKYVSYRAVQTENRPVPPLTDFRVNLYPANRNVITEANQFLVDNFARTIRKRSVKFNVAAEQCLPPSILTRRFSNLKTPAKRRI